MDFPQELIALKNPRFEIVNNKVVIKNRPFCSDYILIIVLVILGLFAYSSDIEYKNDYVGLFSLLFLFSLFNLLASEKITIDVAAKKIYRHNANVLVTRYRKMFQIPSEINFTSVKNVETYALISRHSPRTYTTFINTDDPFKLKLTIFRDNATADIFEKFLNGLLHMHKEEFKGWDFLHV